MAKKRSRKPYCLPAGTYDQKLAEVMQLFDYSGFRPGQEEAMRASIEGENTFVVFPTGGGKTACFWVPTAVTKSWTIVISPLIALINQQVKEIQKLRAPDVIRAYTIHSKMNEDRKRSVFNYLEGAHDEGCLLYVSPEQFCNPKFLRRIKPLRFTRLVIDEAHCVSTWGTSFRREYQQIATAAKELAIKQVTAATATVDPKVIRDIQDFTPLGESYRMIQLDPHRPNIDLIVEQPYRKFNRLCELLDERTSDGAVIINFASRQTCEDTFFRFEEDMPTFMDDRGLTPYIYHGGMDDKYLEHAAEGFLNDSRPVMFATTAFGMGVHRSDVPLGILYGAPTSLFNLAQTLGRTGRNGQPAQCYTLFPKREIKDRAQFQNSSLPDLNFVRRVHDKIRIANTKQEQLGRSGITTMRYLRNVRVGLDKLVEKEEMTEARARVLHHHFALAVKLLQDKQCRLIRPLGSRIDVREFIPGSDAHHFLNEETAMMKREQKRSSQQVVKFFDHPNPTQKLLWDMLHQEKVSK